MKKNGIMIRTGNAMEGLGESGMLLFGGLAAISAGAYLIGNLIGGDMDEDDDDDDDI